MPPSFSTSNRMYFLTLQEIEEDELLIEEMTGHEAMSQLFEFRLRLLSESVEIDPRKIIGKPAILRIEGESMEHMGGERHWNGVVSRFLRTGRAPSAEGGDLYTYECDIVPWFWFMTQHEDCRIFQNKTVREIVETIFDEFSYSDFRFELTGAHPSLEYCTQYNETTFAFISRLLERDGIHYYFRHNEEGGESRHILVFTDNNGSNPALDPAIIPFHQEGVAEEGFDAIRTLSLDQQMRTRRVTLRDWDFLQKRVLQEDTPTVLGIGADRELEWHRYPGPYVDPNLGKYRSRVLMEAEESSHMRFRGDSQVRTLAPGHTFTLENHTFDEFDIEYMVLSVWHHGRNNLTGEGPSDYGNEFTLQPHEVTWRAPLSTPKALVRGPQTALVTGPRGEEIHTDEHGRIKIQFHWDRQGNYDDKSSCWVRVAQVWAGNGYGTMFIPRVGMEVVVDFLEGDPDQPLVTGCVYNGVNKPPYALPANATRSTLKTLSSKGGGGTNELRFEDKKGSEEVFLHAEKDLQTRVKHDSIHFVGNDSHSNFAKNRYEETIEEFHQITGQNRVTLVRQEEHLDVQGDIMVSSSGGNLNLSASQDFRGKGNANLHLKAGANLVLDAGATLSLKAGGSSVVLGPAGVSIVGTMVNINSGGSGLSATDAATPQSARSPLNAVDTEVGAVVDPIQRLQAQALINAARQAQPYCAECEAARAAYEALMA